MHLFHIVRLLDTPKYSAQPIFMAVVEAHASVVPTSLTNSHQSETTVLKTGDSQHCELLVTKAAIGEVQQGLLLQAKTSNAQRYMLIVNQSVKILC